MGSKLIGSEIVFGLKGEVNLRLLFVGVVVSIRSSLRSEHSTTDCKFHFI
jgi:hypothetical protein